MLIHEDYLSRERKGKEEAQSYYCGESDYFEPFTTDRKRLFLALQKEHGACTGSVRLDTKDGAKRTGWVFARKVGGAIHEVWVTLHERKPDGVLTQHPLFL